MNTARTTDLWTAQERETIARSESPALYVTNNDLKRWTRTVAALIERAEEAASFLEKINGFEPVDAITADGIALRLRALLESLR